MKYTFVFVFLLSCLSYLSHGQQIPMFFGELPLDYKALEYVEIILITDGATLKKLVP